jgi:hypothetical protein
VDRLVQVAQVQHGVGADVHVECLASNWRCVGLSVVVCVIFIHSKDVKGSVLQSLTLLCAGYKTCKCNFRNEMDQGASCCMES